MRWKRTALLLVIIPAIVGLWPGHAAALQGFGISPTQQSVTLAPGASTKGQLIVINDGDTDLTYRIYATDFAVKGEDYEGVFTNAGSGPDSSVASWFGLPSGNFVVKARKETSFSYTLTAPKQAAVGGHYGAVFIQTIPPASSGAAIINRVDRIGSLFYITVSGALKQQGQLLSFDLPWLQPLPPIQAYVRLNNTGNVHFLVTGSAQLSGLFGGKIGYPVQWRGEVLPGTTRRFVVSMPESKPIGIFKSSVAVTYLGRTVHESGWVLLVPRLTFVIVAISVLLLLGLGLWALVRRTKRRLDHK